MTNEPAPEDTLATGTEPPAPVLRALCDHAPAALFLIDGQRRCQYANREWNRITGCDWQQIPDGAWLNLVHPEDRASVVDQLNRPEGEAPPAEQSYRVTRGDGQLRWMTLRMVRLGGDMATDLGRVAVLEDITARRTADEERSKLESQLRQAQRMESLGTLAGGIAHDFNNILGVFWGYLELFRMELPPEVATQSKGSLDAMEKAAQRASDLVRQILAFGRRTAPTRVSMNLVPIVKEVLKFLRSTFPANISIGFEAESELPSIEADPSQIHQVLMNLLINAHQAMEPEGGKMGLRLQCLETGSDPALDSLPRGRYLRVSVWDSGKGIPKANLDRIFEPFFTTRPPGKGTGLGLSVAHAIISAHGGKLGVESRPGQGSTFQIYLPVVSEAPSKVENATRSHPRGQGQCIAVIDDESALVQILCLILTHLGYRPTGYADPTKALQAITSEPALYALVITDLTMPDMTGVELSRRIQAIRRIPTILSTGYARQLDGAEHAHSNIVAVLDKPWTADRVATVVAEALRAGAL